MPVQLNKYLGALLYYCFAYMVIVIILAFVLFAIRTFYDYGKVVIECRYPMMTAWTITLAVIGLFFLYCFWKDYPNGELADALL
jgi:hypothetical protein